MQLNPARGRKLFVTEISAAARTSIRFMQLNPARGRKPSDFVDILSLSLTRFMQLNPARGRKPVMEISYAPRAFMGLCSSTPRGDGNS